MSEKNKSILENGNAAIAEGNNEGFLVFCADDTEWTFVGDRTLKGKEALRQYMATAYVEPPKFTVAHIIAEGEFLTVLGDILIKDEQGKGVLHSYCDVWRFRDGEIVELKAFVIKPEPNYSGPARVEGEADITLVTSIQAGDLAVANELIRSGADVNRRDPEGFSPLMIAAGLGQSQMVELLLAAGAEVLAIEPCMGATALHKAAQSGHTHIIGILLDHGSFIDQQSPVLGNTPLMDAVVYKHEESVRLLLQRGARTTIRNYWQQTAYEIAQHDGLGAIAALIKAREEGTAERVGDLMLMTAIQTGDISKVKQLIDSGVAMNESAPMVGTLDDDYTPLGIAAREGHTEIVRLLLDAGADPRQVIGLMKGTSLHEAAYFGFDDIIKAMTENRGLNLPTPDLDAQGPYNGFTALHDAVWHGHLEAARSLVEAGARLDLKTHAGLTPRELALLYRYNDLAEILADAERKYSDLR